MVSTAVWGLETKSYVRDLTSDKFRLTSEKEAQEIKCFSKTDEPFIVGFVVDFSSSIGKSVVAQSIDGIRSFIDTSNPKNSYFAVGFTGKPFVLMEPTSDWATIEAFLVNAVTRERKGRSSLYDAIAMALNKLSSADDKRKVLIIFSDGQENNSKAGDGRLVRKNLRDAGVRTFVASIVDARESYNDERIANEKRLAKIAAETGGGLAFRTKEAGLAKYFEKLAKMMRNEYTLGFSPAKAENNWSPITYAVKVPKNFERITTTGVERFFY